MEWIRISYLYKEYGVTSQVGGRACEAIGLVAGHPSVSETFVQVPGPRKPRPVLRLSPEAAGALGRELVRSKAILQFDYTSVAAKLKLPV